MLRALERLGMLHRGYSSRIWVAGWLQACFQLRPDDDDDAPCLRGLILRGSLRGSAEGGRFSLASFLGGMGAGSVIQLR